MSNKVAGIGTVLGTFAKAVSGSLALNFGVSGGDNCSPSCNLRGNGCYAQRIQAHKSSVRINLERKQENLLLYLRAILARVDQLVAAPWIRFSAFGSVPESLTTQQVAYFKALALRLSDSPVHFPVESAEKALLYRSLGFRPRLSLGRQNVATFVAARVADYPTVSLVAGAKRGKSSIPQAHVMARDLRAHGITAIVCPAIAGGRKCGQCTACADQRVDAVIYPFHV
jgi:hypothetical protein